MVTNASLEQSTTARTPDTASAFLFPSFRFVPKVPLDSSGLQRFLKAFVLPEKLNSMHNVLSEEQKQRLVRDVSLQSEFRGTRDVEELVILICGHGGRDARCGTLGPILQAEFADQLQRRGVQILSGASDVGRIQEGQDRLGTARIGLISHIGGHKYAGNVIVYVPPSWRSSKSSLNGMGIWYGRVRPEDIEGIVDQTLFQGTIIENLYRGRVEQGRNVI